MQATPLKRLADPADPSMAAPIHQQPKPAATYLGAARAGTVLAPVTGRAAPMATTTAYNVAFFRGGRRGPARGTIVAVSSSAKRNNEEGDRREEQAPGTRTFCFVRFRFLFRNITRVSQSLQQTVL